MSTNYYLNHPTGPTYHIGKSSGGWQFLFDTVDNLSVDVKSCDDWKVFIDDMTGEGWLLEDEYGREVKMAVLVDIIQKAQATGVNCWTASEELMGPAYGRKSRDEGYFFDRRGFWFSKSKDFG